MQIKLQAQQDFQTNGQPGKPAFVANDNPLAIWMNLVLHHLAMTHPRRSGSLKIALDPFAASLSLIDHLLEKETVARTETPKSDIGRMRFKVALSFPGEQRKYVEAVANGLVRSLGKDAVFYDFHYQAQLARPNLDVLLQAIYHDNSDLIVVFLCKAYAEKEWCGLELRAIRDLIKRRQDHSIMLMRFDNAEVAGIFSIDGYVDLSKLEPDKATALILERLHSV